MNQIEVYCDSLPAEVKKELPADADLEAAICKAIDQTLCTHQLDDSEISVAIVGDEKIHEINRQFLNHDYETDVITFDLRDPDLGATHMNAEIVISAETAHRQANEMETSTLSEILLYAIHGTLHLAGFDDHEDEDRKKMRNAEREMMQSLGLEYKFEALDSDQRGAQP